MRPDWAAPPPKRRRPFFTLFFLVIPPLVAVVGTAAWLYYGDVQKTLTAKFEGRRWDFPTKVYSDADSVYVGVALDRTTLLARLTRRGYRRVPHRPEGRGEYRVVEFPPAIELRLKAFQYPTYRERGRGVRIETSRDGLVNAMVDLDTGEPLFEVSLEPVMITGLHGDLREDRREMKLAEIPVPLVRAIVTVEDRRFFEHFGVDLRGLARAIIVNVRAGRVRQGGSTLTQQLMKNFFLTDERTIVRKLKEAFMAVLAERRFSKQAILESYLNEIYLGQKGAVGVHGIWEAARFYFGREPRELGMGQIALIAGLIRAPNYYSPHTHPDRALERRNVVLRTLLRAGEIDQRTYRAALAESLGVVPPPPSTQGSPYFVDNVRRELDETFPDDVLTTEGYSVFTTLDPELQSAAETAVAQGLERLERDYPFLLQQGDSALQASLVATNPRTGAILAMVGGRDYRRSQFNRVTDAKRQPGSVFKPIVYLTALSGEVPGRVHYLPTTLIEDAPFVWEYDGKHWEPHNYEDEYGGLVTVRHALARSLNAATASVARDVGIEAVRDMAVRLGIDEAIPPLPAISLGGWEVTPLEVAKVYGVFASGGLATEPISISKVVSREGALVEGNRVEIRSEISAADAYLVTQLLEGVVEAGTGRKLRRLGFMHPAAGKTGTTNDYNDAWFAGYTRDVLAVVWVGFDRDAKLGLTGATAALPIWAEFMKHAVAGREPRPFEVPDGIVFEKIDVDTGMVATWGCRDTVREAFLEGEQVSLRCSEH